MAGNWKLDIVQSEFGSGPAPKSVAGTIFKETPQKSKDGKESRDKQVWHRVGKPAS
jgi:hypothetical protein